MSNTRGFPIDLRKNGVMYAKFSSLKEAAQYVLSKVPLISMNKCYMTVNKSIDDNNPWFLNNDRYDFVTTEKIRHERSGRRTR